MTTVLEKPTNNVAAKQGQLSEAIATTKREVSELESATDVLAEALEKRKISQQEAEEQSLGLDELISRRSQVIATKELLAEKEMQLSNARARLVNFERQHYQEDAMNQVTDLAKALSDEQVGFHKTLDSLRPTLKTLAKELLEKRDYIWVRRNMLTNKVDELLPDVKLGYGGKQDDTLKSFFAALEARGVNQRPLRDGLPLKADTTGLMRFELTAWTNPYRSGPQNTINLDTVIENLAHAFIEGLEEYLRTKGQYEAAQHQPKNLPMGTSL
jgi:hypothetical protein